MDSSHHLLLRRKYSVLSASAKIAMPGILDYLLDLFPLDWTATIPEYSICIRVRTRDFVRRETFGFSHPPQSHISYLIQLVMGLLFEIYIDNHVYIYTFL